MLKKNQLSIHQQYGLLRPKSWRPAVYRRRYESVCYGEEYLAGLMTSRRLAVNMPIIRKSEMARCFLTYILALHEEFYDARYNGTVTRCGSRSNERLRSARFMERLAPKHGTGRLSGHFCHFRLPCNSLLLPSHGLGMRAARVSALYRVAEEMRDYS